MWKPTHNDIKHGIKGTGMCFIALFILLCSAAGLSSQAHALPKNFRNVDTFFVGGMPSVDDITELSTLGVTSIISLHRLTKEQKRRAQKHGIKLYSFPLRTRLLHIEEIMNILRQEPIDSVYIHCLHGADRTGAVTAYWLVNYRDMDPFTALASVISPSDFHIRGYRMLGREYGICLPPPDEKLVGRYSGAKNGGLEGLKICGNEWYTKLARNYLLKTMGPPTRKSHTKFWDRVNHKTHN